MSARLLFAVLAVSVGVAADAQPRIGVDVGAAIPTGALGANRTTGVATTVSVSRRGSGLMPRLGVALAHLPDGETVSENGLNSGRGDYTPAGLRLAVMYRGRGTGVVPYGLVGGGLYVISIERDQNPYGNPFGGLHAGVGVEVTVRSVRLAAEVGGVALATDYGAGAFHFPTVQVPVTVGIRF